MKRAEVFRNIYMKMKQFAQARDVNFLLVNQISTPFTEGINYRVGSAAIPSLGNTVTQFTHNRYMVCRRGSTYPPASIFDMQHVKDIDTENVRGVANDVIRDFYVIFSPRLGPRRTSFTVTQDGVVPLY